EPASRTRGLAHRRCHPDDPFPRPLRISHPRAVHRRHRHAHGDRRPHPLFIAADRSKYADRHPRRRPPGRRSGSGHGAHAAAIPHPSALIPLLALIACAKQPPIVVGSKNFTESVILGEMLAQKLESAGCTVDRRLNLGGTLVCDAAIASGSLDSYVEYSGTALTAILHRPAMNDRTAVDRQVASTYAKRNLPWGP